MAVSSPLAGDGACVLSSSRPVDVPDRCHAPLHMVSQDLRRHWMEKLPGVHHTLPCVPLLCDLFSSLIRQSQALLLWMMPGHCHSPAWPCSSSMTPTASSSTCYGATGIKGVFVSAEGIPNPLWLLHSLLGCASQGNMGV